MDILYILIKLRLYLYGLLVKINVEVKSEKALVIVNYTLLAAFVGASRSTHRRFGVFYQY